MSNLVKRALTGTAYIAVVLAGILIPHWWALTALAIILMVPSVIEFSRMFLSDPHLMATVTTENFVSSRKVQPTPDEPVRPIVYVDVVFLAMMLFTSSIVNSYVPTLIAVSHVCFVLVVLYLLFRLFFTINDHSANPLLSWGKFICAVVYIAVPLWLMSIAQAIGNYLLIIFVMIWCNDTGAYLVGCRIGKHKMCPRLSPKKTWEGFAGGVVFSVIAGIVWALVKDVDIVMMVIFGIVMSIAATYGDLFESMIKRRAAVKDSGSILPGHGGMLDRIDSLLFCIPVAVVTIYILEYFFAF